MPRYLVLFLPFLLLFLFFGTQHTVLASPFLLPQSGSVNSDLGNRMAANPSSQIAHGQRGTNTPAKERGLHEKPTDISLQQKKEEDGTEFSPDQLASEISSILNIKVRIEKNLPLAQGQGLVLVTPGGGKILALFRDARIFLGDVYSRAGENLSANLARRHGYATVLETFSTALEKVSAAIKEISCPREFSLEPETFERFQSACSPLAVPGLALTGTEKMEHGLFLLHSPTCSHCELALSELEKVLPRYDTSFRLIPVMLNEEDPLFLCKKMKVPAGTDDRRCAELSSMIRSNTELVRRHILPHPIPLTTPFYIWKLADGSILAGSMTSQAARKRLERLYPHK